MLTLCAVCFTSILTFLGILNFDGRNLGFELRFLLGFDYSIWVFYLVVYLFCLGLSRGLWLFLASSDPMKKLAPPEEKYEITFVGAFLVNTGGRWLDVAIVIAGIGSIVWLAFLGELSSWYAVIALSWVAASLSSFELSRNYLRQMSTLKILQQIDATKKTFISTIGKGI